jgi:FeS assembly SUF system protein
MAADNPRKSVSLGLSRVTGQAEARPTSPAPSGEVTGTLEDRIIAAIKTCYDPELPVNIYELGLIYDLQIDPAGTVAIRMTLTSPGCPVAGSLVKEVQTRVEGVPGVASAHVELVWDPPWDKSRMSEAAQLELGLF